MTLQGSESLRLARYDRLAELDDHHTSKPVMIGVMSSISTRGNPIFVEFFKTTSKSILHKNTRNIRFFCKLKL